MFLHNLFIQLFQLYKKKRIEYLLDKLLFINVNQNKAE
jgi:hypothetical protein